MKNQKPKEDVQSKHTQYEDEASWEKEIPLGGDAGTLDEQPQLDEEDDVYIEKPLSD